MNWKFKIFIDTYFDTDIWGIFNNYCFSLLPLVRGLEYRSECDEGTSSIKQIWYADDSAASGQLSEVRQWWDNLLNIGPHYGYFPKASKTWLIVKSDYEEAAKEMFKDVNITTVGHKYLGSFIGTEEGVKDFIEDQIVSWSKDIRDLSRIAESEPQLAYAAFVYGTSKKWIYVTRTTPYISEMLKPLEYIIQESFIPAIVGKSFFDDDMRKILALPARHGGLGIGNVTELSQKEYENSVLLTSQLTSAILHQEKNLTIDQRQIEEERKKVIAEKESYFKEKKDAMMTSLPQSIARQLELISESGVSCVLTTLPLKEYGFTLNKREFHDYIAFRYNLKISDMSRICGCNQENSINHSLICKKGGYPILRHNSLCGVIRELLVEAGCNDVLR